LEIYWIGGLFGGGIGELVAAFWNSALEDNLGLCEWEVFVE